MSGEALDRLEAGEWVKADEVKGVDVLIVFSLIHSGKVRYGRRWFKRGKWLRRVK